MMDTYSLLREFADSWALLALVALFGVVIVWAIRPGSNAIHRDTARIPFRHDDKPADATQGAPVAAKDAPKEMTR
jgi:cytochrome c oxidase cbb3-type subunit IV